MTSPELSRDRRKKKFVSSNFNELRNIYSSKNQSLIKQNIWSVYSFKEKNLNTQSFTLDPDLNRLNMHLKH